MVVATPYSTRLSCLPSGKQYKTFQSSSSSSGKKEVNIANIIQRLIHARHTKDVITFHSFPPIYVRWQVVGRPWCCCKSAARLAADDDEFSTSPSSYTGQKACLKILAPHEREKMGTKRGIFNDYANIQAGERTYAPARLGHSDTGSSRCASNYATVKVLQTRLASSEFSIELLRAETHSVSERDGGGYVTIAFHGTKPRGKDCN